MSDSRTTTTERVAAGAAWLDGHLPGWVDDIDLDILNLASTCDCVLGQLAYDLLPGWSEEYDPEYHDVRVQMVISHRQAAELGFTTHSSFYDLTEAWADLITERRTSA